MNQSKLLLTIVSCLFIMSASGKDPKKKGSLSSPPLQTQLMDQQVSELMADKVNTNKVVESLAEVEFFSEEALLEAEALMFPADELYGSNWDNTWVNPFRSKEINFPDTFHVDCRSFSIPIDGEVKVTSKYGPRRRRMHRGIDLKVQTGDTIRSAFSGKVRIKGFERRGYGYYLVIRHSNGLETIYGHLSKFLVNEDEIVKTGQPIALGGNTGRSTGSHLHFETRFLGQALDPSDLIDFEFGVPHNDFYTIYNNKSQKSNVYTSTSERIVYHRVKKGETLGQIALKYKTTVNELCRLNGLSRNSTLRIGQSIRCGTTAVKTAKKAEENSGSDATQNTALYHQVEENETLNSIAKKYGTTVDALCRLNNIQATVPLKSGQQICYKGAAKTAVNKKEQITASAAGQQTENTVITTSQTKTTQPVYYRVRKGDTLGVIARKHGVTINQLCEMNNITSTTILKIGRSLRCS